MCTFPRAADYRGECIIKLYIYIFNNLSTCIYIIIGKFCFPYRKFS